jgi:hypothetical protein
MLGTQSSNNEVLVDILGPERSRAEWVGTTSGVIKSMLGTQSSKSDVSIDVLGPGRSGVE